MVTLEYLLVHTRVAHDATLEIGDGRGFDEVHEAFVVFRPQGEVGDQTAAGDVVRIAFVMRLRHPVGVPRDAGFVLARGFRRHIRFDADDRLDALVYGVTPELVGTVHIAVVGDADGRHAEFLDALDQIRDFRGTIKQRVMRMVVQLDEVSGICHAVHSNQAS